MFVVGVSFWSFVMHHTNMADIRPEIKETPAPDQKNLQM
jgi:hypothetical protein